MLDSQEKNRMKDIEVELNNLLAKEETKACQRSRDRFIKEGDRNTSYFHAIASQRKRKKKIDVLDGPLGPVDSDAEMLSVASDFYKNLFAREERANISLGNNFWDPRDLLTPEESEGLEKPFTEEVIKQAVFDSYASCAPGPDGFSFLFYQKFWDLIKTDFMSLVRDFESGSLNVARLNYAIITLIPKEPDARDMKKFRPISLGNCSLKIILKLLLIGFLLLVVE